MRPVLLEFMQGESGLVHLVAKTTLLYLSFFLIYSLQSMLEI